MDLCAFVFDIRKEVIKDINAAFTEDPLMTDNVAERITPLAVRDDQIWQFRCDVATNQLMDIAIHDVQFEATLAERGHQVINKAVITVESVTTIRIPADGKPTCGSCISVNLKILAKEPGCNEDATCRKRLSKLKQKVTAESLSKLIDDRLQSRDWSAWIAQNKFITTVSKSPTEVQKKQADDIINILKTKAFELPFHPFLQEAIPEARWKAVYAANGKGVTVRVTDLLVRELHVKVLIATNCNVNGVAVSADLSHMEYTTIAKLNTNIEKLITKYLPK